jgi:hypothetical protein
LRYLGENVKRRLCHGPGDLCACEIEDQTRELARRILSTITALGASFKASGDFA